MATPEIKAGQLNKADLEKLKKANPSMPKTETTSSSKLADTLSGNKTNGFGKLSKNSGSLASSLSSKSSGTKSSEKSIFGSNTKTEKKEETPAAASETTTAPVSDVSIYEQGTINSRVNSLQNDIITAKNSSIFSAAKSGNSVLSESDLDFSASAYVQTCIGKAKRIANDAASAANSENWTEARRLYQDARKKLQEAQAEINKAKRNGEDLSKYETEINKLDSDYTSASQKSVSSSNPTYTGRPDTNEQLYAQTLMQYNSWLNQEKSLLYAGLSGCTGTASTTASSVGFAGLFGNALAQAIPGMLAQSVTNGGKSSDGAGKSDGAKGSDKSSGSEKTQGSKRTGGSGSSSKSGSSDSVSNKKGLNTNGANEAAKEEIKKQDLENKFKQTSDNIQNYAGQRLIEKDKLAKTNADLEKIRAAYNKEEGELKNTVKEYDNAKKAAEKKEQEINAQVAIQDAQEKIMGELDKQKISNEKKLSSLRTTESKQKTTYTQAQVDTTKAKAAWEAAEAATPRNEAEVSRLHGEYIKAEQAEQKAKTDLEKTQNEIKALEKDNAIIDKKHQEALKKKEAAMNKTEKLREEKADLESKVSKLATTLNAAGEKAKQYKTNLDKLYNEQTTQQGKIDEFTAKIQAESQKQDTIQERTDSIIKAMNGEYADEDKPGWWNPRRYGFFTKAPKEK